MTPEQQRIIKALLAGGMPAGDMSGASPFRQRAMMQQAQKAQQGRADAFYDAQPGPSGVAGAGLGGMTEEPFDPREEMSAPMPPNPSPMPTPQAAAQPQWPDSQALQQIIGGDPAFSQMFRDLDPYEQARVITAVAHGDTVEEALAPQGFTTRR